jgi:hypothetical protein
LAFVVTVRYRVDEGNTSVGEGGEGFHVGFEGVRFAVDVPERDIAGDGTGVFDVEQRFYALASLTTTDVFRNSGFGEGGSALRGKLEHDLG